MKFPPIVDRELRVASRKSATHWIRLGAALVALLIGGYILLGLQDQPQRFLGTALFISLSIFCYVYCILVGLRTTADCLSQEKREGTLGLLFLTDLKGYDIVLGKLAATSLNAFYGLLAVVPVMAIPLLVGGVTAGEFWRVVLCALNAMFFSLAAGMLASVLNTDERKAMFTTLAILIFFVAILPLLGALEVASRNGNRPAPIFFLPSPGYAAFDAFDEIRQMLRNGRFDFYWESMACVHGLGWGFLWLACLIVPTAWRGRLETVARARRRQWWHQFKYGLGGLAQTRRASMLNVNPIYWLTGRDRFKAWVPLLFLGVGGFLWFLGWAEWEEDWLDGGVSVVTALTAHTVLKLRMASEACYQFAQDKRSGSLELVLTTPLRVRQIVSGQLLSLTQQFLLPVLLVLGVDLLFLLGGPRHGRTDWVVVWLAGMGMFAADMVTLAWVGMWFGVLMGQVGRATATTVFYIMTLPWAIFATLMTVIIASRPLQNFLDYLFANEDVAITSLWATIGVTVDMVCLWVVRRRLLTRFRTVATQRARKKFRPWRFS